MHTNQLALVLPPQGLKLFRSAGPEGLRNVESVFTQLGAIWRNLHGKTKQNPGVCDRDGVGCWPSSRFTPGY